MKYCFIKILLVPVTVIMTSGRICGQSALPEELTSESIDEQIRYLEDRTRIYENYRAIREDMFQKVNRNIRDTLSAKNSRIAELDMITREQEATYDSLYAELQTTAASLKEMTATKNSIKVIGMEVNKVAYNSIMWTVIMVLAGLLSVGFLIFKRNLTVSIEKGRELHEMKEEFEKYRQTTRIAREKAQMEHFNEIKKLKGK